MSGVNRLSIHYARFSRAHCQRRTHVLSWQKRACGAAVNRGFYHNGHEK